MLHQEVHYESAADGSFQASWVKDRDLKHSVIETPVFFNLHIPCCYGNVVLFHALLEG